MTDNLFDLTGRVALVTGSSRGIGKAIAIRMAQHGADVVISSRRQDACDAAAADIEQARGAGWGRALALAANIGKKDEVEALIAQAVARLGKVDILVCNAALNIHVGPTHSPTNGLSEAVMRKVVEGNVMSLFWLTQAVVPGMVARGAGRIIFIASLAGLRGNGGSLSYGMTKAAGISAMQTLAVELGPHNIRCNSIAPGMIRTDMTRAVMQDPAALAAYVGRSPAGAVGEPDEIAGAAVFLASKAGAHMNGQTLVLDGGYSQA